MISLLYMDVGVCEVRRLLLKGYFGKDDSTSCCKAELKPRLLLHRSVVYTLSLSRSVGTTVFEQL